MTRRTVTRAVPAPAALALQFATMTDRATDLLAKAATWAVGLSCFISAGNAIARFAFNFSSNALLEVQWYLFAACVMLGASQVLRLNEHVRVDLVYSLLPARTRVWVDLCGLLFFLLPVMGLMSYLSWPVFVQALHSGEMSPNAGGLIRWPALALMPLGFFLVTLQGVAEVLKRLCWLHGLVEMNVQYERPLQ